MNSTLFHLNAKDFAKGAASAVIAAIVFAVAGTFSQPDFNLFTADWNGILQLATNAAVASFVGYLGKNFMSDNEGKIFGKIG